MLLKADSSHGSSGGNRLIPNLLPYSQPPSLLYRSAYMSMSVSVRNKMLIPMYWLLTFACGRDGSLTLHLPRYHTHLSSFFVMLHSVPALNFAFQIISSVFSLGQFPITLYLTTTYNKKMYTPVNRSLLLHKGRFVWCPQTSTT